MFSKIMTVALAWPDGSETEIQTDISKGLPYFDITGMGDTAVREASRRVRRAIVNSGFEYPKGRIAINLAPAYIKKSGRKTFVCLFWLNIPTAYAADAECTSKTICTVN